MEHHVENRETFFARLTPFMPPSELRMVEVAYMMAKYAHRAQVRNQKDANGDPVRYFEHLRGVALIMLDEANIRVWEALVAAFLHDSLEDTKDITPEIIDHLFGPRVCQIVKLLSKCPKEGYLERLQKYGDSEVVLLKACDRLHNLRSMKDCSPEFITKQLVETETKYMPIFRQFEDESPALSNIVGRIQMTMETLRHGR